MNVLRRHTITTILRKSLFRSNTVCQNAHFDKLYHDDSKNNNQNDEDKPLRGDISAAITTKYEVFKDEDSPVILDVDEERLKYQISLEETKKDDLIDVNLNRGVQGVYDIEDLVELLRREKLEDIFVVSLPPDTNYVDYIVVVTGKSFRHMSAVAQFIRKVFKRKRNPSDIIPKIEGENSKDWMALDLGNIALHIFSRTARPIYDLESLWSLGSQFDAAYNKPEDPFIALLQKHSVYLGDLQPADRAG